MAFAASCASATTLEVNGVTQTGSLTITASLETGTTLTMSRTDGSFANTCTGSHKHGIMNTTNNNGVWAVTGPLTGHTHQQKTEGQKPEDGLSYSGCTRPLTVHDPGTLEILHIAGTTDGTVYSEETQLTMGSPFGTLSCKTGDTTKIGTLTGTDGTPVTKATMHVNAVLNCGFLVPSAKWVGSYEVTIPHLLGVEA